MTLLNTITLPSLCIHTHTRKQCSFIVVCIATFLERTCTSNQHIHVPIREHTTINITTISRRKSSFPSYMLVSTNTRTNTFTNVQQYTHCTHLSVLRQLLNCSTQSPLCLHTLPSEIHPVGECELVCGRQLESFTEHCGDVREVCAEPGCA